MLILFKILLKTPNFDCIEESTHVFQELKSYIGNLFVLNKPTQGETLFMYLVVTVWASSSVLVRKYGLAHPPIYFVSHALKGNEINCTVQEKLALALVITTRKLRPYFLSQTITVLTESYLEKIVSHPDASRRISSGRPDSWIRTLSSRPEQL